MTTSLISAPLQTTAASQDAALAARTEKLAAKAEGAAGAADDPKKVAEIRKLAEDFESIFLGLVLKSMRQTIQKSGLVDGGNAEDIYRSMLDDEYTKQMAQQHHTGLADSISDFLLKASQNRGQAAYGAAQLPQGAKQATMIASAASPAAAPAPESSAPAAPSRQPAKGGS